MSETVIRCNNVSKLYRLGERESYETLRDVISNTVTAPWQRLRRRRRTASESNGHQEKSDLWALKDVSFQLKQGEVLGIIGRNGAGKSTLLKILSRITKPTMGSIEIYGRVGSLLEVGTGFHPELTGRENIFLNGAMLGMKRAEIQRKFDEIVAFAEVERFIDTPVKRYSSGMYVRLAFGVAAHLEPEILIVDEVLAVGDASFQRKCLDKMQDAGKGGRTVLFVSHNMPAVMRLCQRAIHLDKGSVINDGPSDSVVSGYLREGTTTSGLRVWPDMLTAPGNEIAKLCSVRVLNTEGQVAETLDIREEIKIEIEYYNFSTHRFPFANVQLFDENGTLIFASGDFTNLDWRHRPRNFTGRVKSMCTIPGNFLSEGKINVLVALTTHVPAELIGIERDAVSFLVVDNSQGDGARGEYTGAFPGIVRPLLDWQVNFSADENGNKGGLKNHDDGQ